MSTINKLSIRGIRSFGTSKEDEQKIVFTSPLTLIVGENGCGKTTIIECLKYGLTGEVPPGSNAGRLFVHDPKVFGNGNISHAQVALEVTNIKGVKKQCIRTSTVSYAKDKLSFKTVDSSLRDIDDNGRPKDEGSNRVEVVNCEMANSMGVSKAILNNVIFCHQEDSAWPLDEGQKLKQKFDAIFGTTEYNKAIDKIIKFRKEYQDKLKLCVQEKRFLEETKNDADRKQLDYDILKTKHGKLEKEFADTDKDMDPIEKRLEVLFDIEKDYMTLMNKKTTVESMISNYKANEEATRKRIKEVLENEYEDIERMLENFLASMATRKRALESLEDQQKKLEEREKNLNDSTILDKSNVDRIVNEIGQMQELIEQRVKAIKKLCNKLDLNLNIDFESQSMSSDDLKLSLGRIREAIEDKEESLIMQKAEDSSKEDEIQKQIDKVREEKTAAETNITTQKRRIREIKIQHQEKSQEIMKIEKSMPNLPKLTKEIEEANEELQKFKAGNSVTEAEDERDVTEIDKNELESKVTLLEEDVEKLEDNSKLTNEIEQKQRELAKDQNDFERIRNKQSTTLKQILPGKKIEKNFKNSVQVVCDSLEAEVKTMKADLQAARMDDSRLRTEREHLRKQLKSKETELRESKEKVERVTDGADFLDVLASQKEKVDKLNMDLAFHKSSEATMKHYVADIDVEPCCPLCHKNLDNADQETLKDEIRGKIRQLPVKISETERKLKLESKKFYEINECKSAFDSIEKFEKEQKKFQEDLKKTESNFRENTEKINNLEIVSAEPEAQLSILDSAFLSDMVKLDDLQKNISTKTSEIENLKSKLPAQLPAKSLNDAKSELRQLNQEIKLKNENIKSLNQKINQIHSTLHQLQDKHSKLVSKQLEFQTKVQGLDQMKKILKEKEKEKQEIEEKLKEDENKLQPMLEKLGKLSAEKENLKTSAAENHAAIQRSINAFQESQKDIERQSKDIKGYEEKQLESNLMKIEKKISEANEKLRKIRVEKEKNYVEIQKTADENRDHEGTKRNLEDNLELKRIQQQLQESEEELNAVRKKVGDMEPKKIFNEKKELREAREKLIAKQSELRGQITQIKSSMEKEGKELSNPKYRDAKKNFLEGCINQKVLEAIIGDLHKYRAALERALLKFHADKMVQINQGIRTYWNNIYKGNDIDYIMIKTDEEEKKSTSDKKRSYSYRVVQCKNGGSEIDMRGRCSAGQKVLASLIIRMALADTFAANCGVLALDEPTTNLDQKNIQALCEALNDIIKERETIGNFMLVVITHDEEFVRVLENVDVFFKVSRDPLGRSRIEKITKK